MASELYVETLKGLTSGANANKVIVPAGQTLDVSAGTVTGITQGMTDIDTWRKNGTHSSSSAISTVSGWSRQTSGDGIGYVGSGMSESSGVWTFPSTGIWKIDFYFDFYHSSDSKYVGAFLQVSTDGGSNFGTATEAYGSISYVSTNTWDLVTGSHFFDVTSTSLDKVRFQVESANTLTVAAGTNNSLTYVQFMRVGDT